MLVICQPWLISNGSLERRNVDVEFTFTYSPSVGDKNGGKKHDELPTRMIKTTDNTCCNIFGIWKITKWNFANRHLIMLSE